MKGWFSTKLRFAVLVESVGLDSYMDSVMLFQAEDFDSAFQAAVELGRKREQSYRNGDGQRVIWRLAEVISLDIIQAATLDGAEVYSEPVLAGNPNISLDAEFYPEQSTPTQTF